MKAVFLILTIALGSYAAYLQYLVMPNAVAVAGSENAAISQDLSDAKEELKIAKKEITELKKQLKASESKIPASQVQSDSAKLVEAVPTATPATPTDNRDARLAEIEAIYNKHTAELEAKLAILDANEQKGMEQLELVNSQAPKFSEQVTRIDESGVRTYNAGVRTSDADRAKAQSLHAEKVAQAEAYLASIAKAKDEINDQLALLNQKYHEARVNIQVSK